MSTSVSTRHTLSTLALLITLSCGTLPAATAQPHAPAEELAQPEAMQHMLATPSVRAKLNEAQWRSYGQRLARTLASGHEGLQEGALRMIIQYAPYLEMNRTAVFDVVRIYRNHSNDNLRRMAVVALGRMNDAWGSDFLKRSLRYEKSPAVRQTLRAVLAEHQRRQA